MQQTVAGKGLLCALILGMLGFWFGCAGRGEPLNPDDPRQDGSRADTTTDVHVIPASCRNGNKDTGESDLDCGGNYCPPCGFGKSCVNSLDCAKGACSTPSYKCVAPTTCSNLKRDVKETDMDCGGPDCSPCLASKFCQVNSDCSSDLCNDGKCQ
jgi:hypothetical protein